jgi:hypothetical protein
VKAPRDFLSSIGRSLSVLIGAVGVMMPMMAQTNNSYSTFDFGIFGGGVFPQLYQGENGRSITYANGYIFGFRFNEDLWEHFGAEESAGFGFNNLRARVLNDPDVSVFGIGGRNDNITFNGLFYFTPRNSKWRPFLTVGPGLTYYRLADYTLAPAGGPQQEYQMKYSPALVYGAGIKWNATRRIGFRLDVRDTYTFAPHYGLPTTPIANGAVYLNHGGTEHFLSATLGISFHMRIHEEAPPPAPAPPPPPPAPVVVTPAAPRIEINAGSISGAHDVCPGETLQVGSNAVVSGAQPRYQWMVNGNPAPGGTGSSFNVPTTNSGQESISLRVSAGSESQTSAPVNVRVKNYSRPTVQLSLSQSSIPVGGTVAISATPTGSECGDPVRVTLSASEGSINGNTYDSTGVSFDQNAGGLQTKVIHITATATDRTGATGTASADLTVTSKPTARRLEDLIFPTNSARVNNCAKRLLLEVLTPILRSDPNAKVILIGHRDAAERVTTLDRQRVLNAAAVLSAGQGICPQLEVSRIQGAWVGTDQSSPTKPSFCGTSTEVKEKTGQAVIESDTKAQFRRVEVWVVPGGADMPPGVTAQDLPGAAVKALGCPR